MAEESHHMQCMEVWGGNSAMDSAVAVTGLDARVYARPFQMGEADAAVQGGGDVYYVSSCATGRITRIMLADVSGHGTAVADTGILLRGLMRRYVNHVDQRRFVSQLNRAFADQSKAGGFATAVAIGYFAPRRIASICNAGHPPPMLYEAATGRWRAITPEDPPTSDAAETGNAPLSDIPLGVDRNASFTQSVVSLNAGDRLLCYSDSAIESLDCDGRMLGIAGFCDLLNTLTAADHTTLLSDLRSALTKRNAANLTGDDVTLMLLTPNAGPVVASFADRQRGMFAFMKALAKRPFGGEPIPWPEFTWQNFGAGMTAMFRPQRRASSSASPLE